MTAKLKQFIEHRNALITLNDDPINDIIPYKIATLAPIFDFITSEEPNAILNRLTEAATKVHAMAGLSLSERLVNAIAAEIFARIDSFIGKTEDIPA